MIEDISKSIKASMYERATSPLFGSFLIYWAIWNYKTILIVLSSMKVKDKISYIENELYESFWTVLLDCAIYPLLSAVLFILIYPYPSKWIYEYWNNRQKEFKLIKQKIDDETPMTLEEARKVRRELLRLEKNYDEEISIKNNEIVRLKDIVSSLEITVREKSMPALKTNPAANKPSKQLIDNAINDDQEKILFEIAKAGGWVTDKDYLKISKFDTVKTEYYLEDLEAKGFVSRKYLVEKGGRSTTLSTKGKKFAIDNGAVA